ncbi:bifunctional (p)ppGpp synthetase/guanosine-3',5'-bis(diphosphate) 3'-pyrophosphohydrolase [Oscillatoria amoena NRMC-F 0135]|nr:bifunctional (p)ppGpp synthetase/guanosine-3',5'-bis(diphosphate) 3'-pyrophosphohydrolase [Oscillatoria amoena NRMC-F 0135]
MFFSFFLLLLSDKESYKQAPNLMALPQTMIDIDVEAEKQEILKRYRHLLRSCRHNLEKGDKQLIRSAFDMALEAHKNMRRKSGEPYIYHPLAVAQIAAQEIGLGTTSIVCALLHDTVEDTDITLEVIRLNFGDKIAMIIDGLTKISGVFDQTSSLQAENFRKMLLTLSEDVRVILIKLADRLHNMRTLQSMSRKSQLKIASETLYLYAPLAHRLGLYAIKTELEDLSIKYSEPEMYFDIVQKLQDTKAQRNKYIKRFIEPIEQRLEEEGYAFEIKGRPKSIFSILNKMRKQGVPFEEVYDLFAVRIILDVPVQDEKADCWNVYSIVTDSYFPNPDRLRDWISAPKSNGYESLHTTVMGPEGNWVEVQIRTRRMDEIAEKGYAAHWKYKDAKGGGGESSLESWLARVREILESPDANAIDFLDDFKLNLFAEEVFVFTPKGELRKLPANSTALDFAFDIHSDVGYRCIGAKVNNKLVPINHRLSNGDQVEILTASRQKPSEDWINFVVTAKAKSKIKQILREEKKRVAEDAKEMLERKFRHNKIAFTNDNLNLLANYYRFASSLDLLYSIATGKFDKDKLDLVNVFDSINNPQRKESKQEQVATGVVKPSKKPKVRAANEIILGDDYDDLPYDFAKCCSPIPGDEIFGFITVGEGVKIHRTSCPNAIRLMSNYGYRIIKAQWAHSPIKSEQSFLAGVHITGIDSVGVISKITDVVSKDLAVNMKSITVESHEDGTFDGRIMLFISDTEHLNTLIQRIKVALPTVNVNRIDVN